MNLHNCINLQFYNKDKLIYWIKTIKWQLKPFSANQIK